MKQLKLRHHSSKLLKIALVVFTLVTMSNVMALNASATPSRSSPGSVKYVNVAVATLWTEPRGARPIDTPATEDPVDISSWLRTMTTEQRNALVGAIETQALYGQKVIVTGTDGDWVHIVVPGQPTPRDARGYPGWLPKKQLTDSPVSAHYSQAPFAQVQSKTTGLYNDVTLSHKAMDLSFGTRLPVLAQTKHALLVITPDRGGRWMPTSDVAVYKNENNIPKPSGADLVKTARMFLGTTYLWGGMSSYGYDCSGFTYNVYRKFGITIPRDAQDQAVAGTPVATGKWQPGDLLFYAHDNGKGSVHHVGMYVGDGYEIDAPIDADGLQGGVELVKVSEHRYAHEYAGARRYLQN